MPKHGQITHFSKRCYYTNKACAFKQQIYFILVSRQDILQRVRWRNKRHIFPIDTIPHLNDFKEGRPQVSFFLIIIIVYIFFLMDLQTNLDSWYKSFALQYSIYLLACFAQDLLIHLIMLEECCMATVSVGLLHDLLRYSGSFKRHRSWKHAAFQCLISSNTNPMISRLKYVQIYTIN